MSLSQNLLTLTGKIEFEIPNVTKKHEKQGSWKRYSMIMFDGDICEYYAWFLKKRFNLALLQPLRGPHISYVNDNFYRDSKFEIPDEEKEIIWNQVRDKYNGKEIEIVLDISKYHSNDTHWYFIVSTEHREGLNSIRKELGLDKIYHGYHMTIGLVNHKMLEHSKYLNRLHEKKKLSNSTKIDIETIPYKSIGGRDLSADYYCTCPSPTFKDSPISHLMKTKIYLSGYNDDYFFDEVNIEPRSFECSECGKKYTQQWDRTGNVKIVKVK